jgi:hypothetical protein
VVYGLRDGPILTEAPAIRAVRARISVTRHG